MVEHACHLAMNMEKEDCESEASLSCISRPYPRKPKQAKTLEAKVYSKPLGTKEVQRSDNWESLLLKFRN